MEIKKILIEQIDLSDETFSVNYLPDLQSLRSSIEEIGLIQPVLLRKKLDRYQIICGFRKIFIWPLPKDIRSKGRSPLPTEREIIQLLGNPISILEWTSLLFPEPPSVPPLMEWSVIQAGLRTADI